MALNSLKNIFIIIQIVGISFALIATIGNVIVSRKIERFGPYYLNIKTVTATVEVTIESPENVNSHFMDSGGYLAFVKGEDLILGPSAHECTGKKIGNNEVQYRGIFNLDVNDPAFNKPVRYLRAADYIQINFSPMPKESKVLGGRAICIINGSIELNILIPPQETKDGNILIRDIRNIFSNFPENN